MPKTHLESYLEYYLSLESPGFAVLVKGPWGTGKTFQVKKFIPEAKRYYVPHGPLTKTANPGDSKER